MRLALRPAVLVALCILSSGPCSAATTLKLKNGSVVIGEVTKQEGGKVYIKADLLGDLVVNESDVASFSTTEPGAAPEAAAAAAAVPATDSHPIGAAAVAGAPAGAKPNKAYWASTFAVGGSYQSAAYNQGVVPGTVAGVTGARLGLPGVQKSISMSGSIIRATTTDAISLEGNETYADYEPAASAVADNYSVDFAWNHLLDPADYTLTRTTWSVDRVRDIYHSFSELAGVGHKFLDTPADKLDFVPGLVLSNERKDFVFDDKWELGYGFLESYTHNFSASMAIEERVLARTLFEKSSFYAYDAYLGFSGMLTPTFGVKIGLTYNFDNSAGQRYVVVPGVPFVFYPNNKGVLTFTSGFQYKFSTPVK